MSSDQSAGKRIEKPLPPALRAALRRADGRHPDAFVAPVLAVAVYPAGILGFLTGWWIPVVGCVLLLFVVLPAAIKQNRVDQVRRDVADGRYVEWNGGLSVVRGTDEGEKLSIEAAGRLFRLKVDAEGLRQLAANLGGRHSATSSWNNLVNPGSFRMLCVGVLVYLEHASLVLEVRTWDHAVVYRDPRFALV